MFKPEDDSQKYGAGTLVSAGNQKWLIIATSVNSRKELSALNLETFAIERHSVMINSKDMWMTRSEFDELFAFQNADFGDCTLTRFADYDMTLSKYAVTRDV